MTKICKSTLVCLALFCCFGFISPVQKSKPIRKKIDLIWAKPASPGDAPTLNIRFLNAVNLSKTYSLKGNIPLLQFESLKEDGSDISIRNLQDSIQISFTLTLTNNARELIIGSVGITGTGWSMRVNNGPEIPLTNGMTLSTKL